jgi:hypothetical protein
MFFGRRRKWNGQVAALLPAFGLTLDEVGPMKTLEALDLVYPKGFSEQEGALYLAFLCYPTFLISDPARAEKLRERLCTVSEEWIRLGRVNPRNVEAWRKKAAHWESGDFSTSS